MLCPNLQSNVISRTYKHIPISCVYLFKFQNRIILVLKIYPNVAWENTYHSKILPQKSNIIIYILTFQELNKKISIERKNYKTCFNHEISHM